MNTKKDRVAQGSNVILVDDSHLSIQAARPPLKEYIAQLWRTRFFIWAEARSKAFKSTSDLFLGRLWLVLDPIIQASFYALVFGLILKVDRGIDNFIGYLIIGLSFFRIFTAGLSGGSSLIRSQRNLISSFKFPRAALVISRILKEFLSNIIPVSVAILVALVFQWDEPIHWTMLFVVVLYVLAHLFAMGLMFITARAVAIVPDLQSLITLVNRGLFFVSGVFFTIERFDMNPTLQAVMVANPLYQFLQAARSVVMLGEIPTIATWGYLLLWTFSTLIIGFVYFWQAEAKYDNVR